MIFISSNLAILYMSNIGYVLCHIFALSALPAAAQGSAELAAPDQGRRDAGCPIAAALLLLNIVFFVVGAFAPKLNGYGTWTDFGIGVGILFASLLLFFFRRVVQDKETIHWREETPSDARTPTRAGRSWGSRAAQPPRPRDGLG